MFQAMLLEAFAALSAHRLRSALTMLGIVIGVSAVIVMLAVIAGASAQVERRINALGTHLLYVSAADGARGRLGAPRSASSLSLADARAFAALQGVSRTAPLIAMQGRVAFAKRVRDTTLYGTTGDYLEMRDWAVSMGTALIDRRAARAVALLGYTVARDLFASEVPVGKTIRIDGQPFRVLGVLSPKGSTPFADQDDCIIVPVQAAQQRLASGSSRNRVHSIQVEVRTREDVEKTQEAITKLLRARHGIRRGVRDDFRVANVSAYSAALSAANRSTSLMLGAVGVVSLLIGGIGIMNVMLVSVAERAREIGLRKALGATRANVLTQFLTESIVLAIAGCAVGLVLGVAAVQLISSLTQTPMLITGASVAAAVGVSSAVGIFFGGYPALRAAGLDPIEALRVQ